MRTVYSADVEHIDEPIEQAMAEMKPGEVLKIRLQPSIWRRGVSQHRSWAGVSWSVDCENAKEAIDLREGLRAFFEAVQVHGIAAVTRALQPQPAPTATAAP